jgi:hypothetical protein
LLRKTFQSFFQHTLNSVAFGITMMALIALYIAIGSGIAQVRMYFEMSEMAFFNAWPLKVLMTLLVLNLTVVTWTRIPFTPPRYGVWCVHLGIITLIFGTSIYYRHKQEGMVWLPIGGSRAQFYSTEERALFFEWNGRLLAAQPLNSLPRYRAYEPERGNADHLNKHDLQGIEPARVSFDVQTGQPKLVKLSDDLKLPSPLKIDVIAYYPYAQIEERFVEDPTSNLTGLELAIRHSPEDVPRYEFLLGSDANHRRTTVIGEAEVQHRHVLTDAELSALAKAAAELHRIHVKVADYTETLFVSPGKSYVLGKTGYTLAVEQFFPNWKLANENAQLPALTLMVKANGSGTSREFRRMVLSGRSTQTDFILDGSPIGKRQSQPIDSKLLITYAFSNPFNLVSSDTPVRHTIVTSSTGKMIHFVTGMSQSSDARDLKSGDRITVGDEEHHDEIQIIRNDHARPVQLVQVVPIAQRDRNADVAGQFQVIRVRVSMGNWSEELAVPFQPFAGDSDPRLSWGDASVTIPETRGLLRMQLSRMQYPLPASVTLEKFELVQYPGGNNLLGPMRDFKSTLRIADLRDPTRQLVDVAHMNHPIYYDNGEWLFFQAQWDPDGQRYSVIGIGNRPAVRMMLTGCGMIFVGLIYAFYIKPIIIRRMKRNALSRALGKMNPPQVSKQPSELVAS